MSFSCLVWGVLFLLLTLGFTFGVFSSLWRNNTLLRNNYYFSTKQWVGVYYQLYTWENCKFVMPWTQSRYLPWGNHAFHIIYVATISTVTKQLYPSSCYCSLGIIDGDSLSIHTSCGVLGLQPEAELYIIRYSFSFRFEEYIREVYSIHVYIPNAIILWYEAVTVHGMCMMPCTTCMMWWALFSMTRWHDSKFSLLPSFYVACGNTESVCLPKRISSRQYQ